MLSEILLQARYFVSLTLWEFFQQFHWKFVRKYFISHSFILSEVSPDTFFSKTLSTLFFNLLSNFRLLLGFGYLSESHYEYHQYFFFSDTKLIQFLWAFLNIFHENNGDTADSPCSDIEETIEIGRNRMEEPICNVH